jgi:DNA-binding beta-propeller fold protein YncE
VLALVLAGIVLLAAVAVVALLLLPRSGGVRGATAPTTASARPAGAVSGTPIPVGKEPRDVESGEGFVWTANTDGTISKIDPGTGRAQQINVGGVPAEIVVAQGGVWVWNYSDAVTPVDVASGEVGDPVSANGTGNITGTAVGGGYLWLSHSSSNSVSRIDLGTKQATGTPTTVGAEPVSMAFGDRLLYVANSGEKTISVLDGSTGAVRGDPIALTEQPAGIAVEERTIFVGTTGDVTPIDEGSYVVGDPIPLKGGSYFLADSGGIWVSFPLDDQLRWFDLKGQETRGAPVTGVGKGVGDLVLHDGGVWVSDTANDTVVHVRVGG